MLIIVILLCFVIIFGDTPMFKNTLIHTLKHGVLRRLQYLVKTLNNSPYLNWFVPLFYLIVITTCLYLFFTTTWLQIPADIQYSRFHQCYIFVSICSVYSMTLVCIFSNPGYIHKYNVGDVNRHFLNNEIIFFNNNICSTCNLLKPGRSKHCSTCNRCIILMDHHCVWINNCVGYNNYKYFIGWLVSNINFMAFGLYLCTTVVPMSHISLITTSPVYKITGSFIILCILFNLIVIIFLGLQIRYIYLGVSTNEADKWSDIEYLINIGTLYRRQGTYYELINNQLVNMKNDQVYPFFPDSQPVTSIAQVDNIYDKGFFGNLYEKIFPIDFVNDP